MKKTYINPTMFICKEVATSILAGSPSAAQTQFSDDEASQNGGSLSSMDAKTHFFEDEDEE